MPLEAASTAACDPANELIPQGGCITDAQEHKAKLGMLRQKQ